MADQFQYKTSESTTKKLSKFIVPSLLGLGTGLRAGGAIVSGIEAMETYRYNAKAIDEEIRDLGVSADISVSQMERQARKLAGTQAATIGASNISMTSGSMVELMADSAAQAKLDQLITRSQYAAKQQQLEREKEIGKIKAKQTQRGSYFDAFSALAGGTVNILERM